MIKGESEKERDGSGGGDYGGLGREMIFDVLEAVCSFFQKKLIHSQASKTNKENKDKRRRKKCVRVPQELGQNGQARTRKIKPAEPNGPNGTILMLLCGH